jgi:hypothetical protein
LTAHILAEEARVCHTSNLRNLKRIAFFKVAQP